MAEIPYTVESVPNTSRRVAVVTWANMRQGDYGAALLALPSVVRSVQVFGTFGALGELRLRASLVSATAPNFHQLADRRGVSASATSARIFNISDSVPWLRPYVINGDATTDLTTHLLLLDTEPRRRGW